MTWADRATEALLVSWGDLVEGHPGWWLRRGVGADGYVTGLREAAFNGVFPRLSDPDPRELDELLDAVAAEDVPYSIHLRPGAGAAAMAVPERRGMVRGRDAPLMVLRDPSRLARAQEVPGLVLREIAPAEAGVHASLAAVGFEAPEELFRAVVRPELLETEPTRCYLGEVEGVPVTTAIGATFGEHVGVFNVATPPEHRRRGYAAAATARAVADGLAAGASWAWLQSTEIGLPVYEALGFETVERWLLWETP